MADSTIRFQIFNLLQSSCFQIPAASSSWNNLLQLNFSEQPLHFKASHLGNPSYHWLSTRKKLSSGSFNWVEHVLYQVSNHILLAQLWNMQWTHMGLYSNISNIIDLSWVYHYLFATANDRRHRQPPKSSLNIIHSCSLGCVFARLWSHNNIPSKSTLCTSPATSYSKLKFLSHSNS